MMKARNAILEALRYRLGDTLVPNETSSSETLGRCQTEESEQR